MTDQKQETKHYDVLISGGGLSGLLTAIGVKSEAPSLSVAVIEPIKSDPQEAIQSNFDQRCLALSHGTIQLLKHWQVWPEFAKLAWPIQTIVTSDRGHVGKTIMRANDYDVDAMGQVVSMHNLGVALQNVATKHNIDWFCPDQITAVEDITENTKSDETRVTLKSGAELSTKLLVVAEGGNSPTRTLLKIGSDTSNYEQSAVIANVKVSNPTKILKQVSGNPKGANHVAFERFTTTGPIAFLPIGDNEYNVVWTQEPDEALVSHALNDEQFLESLQQTFGFSAGQLVECSKRAHYPLSLTKVERLTSFRTVLLGNSAHTVHPIAGQGFNLGVRDIGVLVMAIASQINEKGEHADIGSFEVLNNYEKNRLNDIKRITDFTDSLVRIFALPGRLPALARSTGLMTLQSCDSLQQWLALHFMGSHKQFTLN